MRLPNFGTCFPLHERRVGVCCAAHREFRLGFRVVLPPSCFSAALGMYSGQDVA